MGELRKSLSMPVIVLITINSIVGSGMFFLPAIGARVAGPSSIIAWVILSLTYIMVAMAFGELGSMYPKAGGIYEFAKQAYGRFTSFFVGWVAWLISNITIAMLVVAAIRYLLPRNTGVIALPFGMSMNILLFKLLFSIFWVLLFHLMAFRGMKTSAIMLVTFSIITMIILLFIAIPSIMHFNIHNLSPFFIKSGITDNIGVILLATFLISETFFGLESVLFLSEETENPRKTIPRALILGMLIISLLTIVLVISSLGAVDWRVFSGIKSLPGSEALIFGGKVNAPFAYLAWKFMGALGLKVITLGTYIVILGAAAGWVVTGPRLILALAKDRLFLSQFANIHEKYHTPYKAIIFQFFSTTLFIILSFFGSGYETLLRLLIPLVLLTMAGVLLTLIILRRKKPDAERPFRLPGGSFTAFLLILGHLALIVAWLMKESDAWGIFKLGMSFIFVGLPVYLLIEFYYDPKMITEVNDIFAYFNFFTEKIAVPRWLKRDVIGELGELKNKIVLEYGCSVGTLTIELAKAVGPAGRVYAVDLSKNELKITRRRIERAVWESEERVHGKVHVIHDPLQTTRVHPSIGYADAIVSIGMLSYIQDVNKVLREMNEILPDEGRICFVEYLNFFRIFPNVEWLNNENRVRETFRKNGFVVHVEKRKGKLWDYIMIYGMKTSRSVEFV